MSDNNDNNTQRSGHTAESYINAIGGGNPYGDVTRDTGSLGSAPPTDADSRGDSSPISPGTRQRNIDDAYAQLTSRAPSYTTASDPPSTAARSSTPVDDATRQRALDATMSSLTGGQTTQYETQSGSTATAGPPDDRTSGQSGQSGETINVGMDSQLAAYLEAQGLKEKESKRD